MLLGFFGIFEGSTKRLYYMLCKELVTGERSRQCGALESIWCACLTTWQAGSIKKEQERVMSVASDSEWLKRWKFTDEKNTLKHIQGKKNRRKLEKTQRGRLPSSKVGLADHRISMPSVICVRPGRRGPSNTASFRLCRDSGLPVAYRLLKP